MAESLFGVVEKHIGKGVFMNWKYVKPTSFENVKEIEKLYGIELTDSLKALIFEANNGRPELDTFDTVSGKGKQFKKILSYNKDDTENMYSCIDLFKDTKLFPFGDDPAGNYICMDGDKVVFFNHESGETEFVANSLKDFIYSLY